ncbi:MAG: phosphoglycerate kinase [Parachlamydia sp.]|nr:MAG: phosphoglycerate kinase [Parachlamydia sp.]
MKPILSINQIPLKGKKVLLRVDFNVPLDQEGTITDDSRIKASLPSIQYILDQGGSVILMSHLGRPKGKASPEYSLDPCAKRLATLIGKPVCMAPDCIGPAVEELARSLKPGEILLLENLRFHEGEEHPEKDPAFVKKLAALGEIYINDAFGTAHRAHASTTEIARYFPGKAAAGFLLTKEVRFLGEALLNPKRPFYAIVGGAKISTKIGVLESLLKKVDALLIGGGMAYTFFKAQGIPIGQSIHEDEFLSKAQAILALAKKQNIRLVLPVDVVVTDSAAKPSYAKTISISAGIPDGSEGVDIGPKTIEAFTSILNNAATILWNGPLGVFEVEAFAQGTDAIAQAVANSHATTIVGGGDSVAALQKSHLSAHITHLSTGGGASLEYIEYGTLPGIEALRQANSSSIPVEGDEIKAPV